MAITWPDNVTLPVSLYGMIPGGTAFQLPAPQSLSNPSYDWTVNIAEGTDVLLLMADASTAQTGGSTPLLEVGQGSTGCMNDTSPSAAGGGSGSGTATSAGPSASVSGVGGTSGGGGGSGQGNTGEGDGGDGGGGGGGDAPIGAIVGGTLGGVAFIVLLAVLLIFCVKRRFRERRGSGESSLIKNYGMGAGAGGAAAGDGQEKRGRFDILAGAGGRGRGGSRNSGGLGRAGSDAEARVGGEEYQPSPFRYPSPPPGSEAAAAAAAAAAGAGGATKASDSRPSHDSSAYTPQHPSSAAPPSSQSQAGRTDDATAGHGVRRGSSIRKSAVPPSPGLNAPRRGVEESTAGGRGEGGEVHEDTARFVQHQDEGPVV